MIRAIIFDLDNCLGPADEIGRDFYEPAFTAIREANDGRFSDEELDNALADNWRDAFDAVARKHAFPQAMIVAGYRAFDSLRIPRRLSGYGDLAVLRALNVPLFLVTSGFLGLQQSKIDALGIADAFEAVYIDVIDDPLRTGKQAIFGRIAVEHHWEPRDVLVVGDNPHAEIAAGNRLGMPTVQILRPGIERDDSAGRHIASLRDLVAIVAENEYASS